MEPKTQEHYGGWDLPKKIWSQMSPAFPGRMDLDWFRMDAMKRLYRLGQKDPPIVEIEKTIDELKYILNELKNATDFNV